MSEERTRRFAKLTLETRRRQKPRWSQEYLANTYFDMTGAAISKWESKGVDPDTLNAKAWKIMARLRGWTLDQFDLYLETGERPAEDPQETRTLPKKSQGSTIPPIEFVELKDELRKPEQRQNLASWLRGQSGSDWLSSGVLAGAHLDSGQSLEEILFSELEIYRIKKIGIANSKIALGIGLDGIRVGENLQSVRVVPKILPLEPELFPEGLKFSVSQDGEVYQSFDIPPKRGAIKVGGEGFVLDTGDRFEFTFELGDDVIEEKFIV
ncbi:MAG: hypothetical protein J7647_27225 [Cyanobacteria bacterium SBLK]|nr:hypothetical protein [Cyanobacteria bacterium SBLK]